MHIVVISDVHCDGIACAQDATFVEWLDGLEVDGLWMLGDIFHAGWSFNGRLQPSYRPVFDALDRVTERGIELVFVPGNHDFGMAGLMADRWHAEVCGPHIREVNGKMYHLSHGDEADNSLGYRFTRWVLRGRVFSGLMRVMGLRLGTKLLRLLAGRVDAGGQDLWPQMEALAMSHLAGADVVLMGHAHVSWQADTGHGTAAVLGPGLSGVRHVIDGVLMP